MPTSLMLTYSATCEVVVPNEIAKKLQENENTEWGKPWSWYVKHATLYYCDEDGEGHRIEGDAFPVDYKHDGGQDWNDPDSSDDESDDESESEPEPCCVGCGTFDDLTIKTSTNNMMCKKCWT